MKNYIIGRNENGLGRVYNEDEVEYVYYYDQECEVEIARELSDKELKELRKTFSKEMRYYDLRDKGLLSETIYNDLTVAKSPNSLILNLENLKVQKVDELYRPEEIIKENKPYGEDTFTVHRLKYEKYSTYRPLDAIAGVRTHVDPSKGYQFSFFYADHYKKPIAIMRSISNFEEEGVQAKTMDMEECFKILKDHFNDESISNIYDYLIESGISKDFLPNIIKNEEAIER